METAFPSDPLERLQFFWHRLFFGVLERVRMSDPKLHLRVQFALKQHGLLDPGEMVTGKERTRTPILLTRSSSAFSLRPDDVALRCASAFRESSGRLPSLRGKLREGRQGPPLLSVLMKYSERLAIEREGASRRVVRGGEAPHDRAVRAAAKDLGYTSEATFRKHLERAQQRFPEVARLWRGKGAAVWEQSEQ